MAMRIEPLGDSAYIVRDLGDVPSYTLAAAIERLSLPGVIEIVPAYDTLGVYVEPAAFDRAAFQNTAETVRIVDSVTCTNHRVPVCYELGEDLDAVATELALTPASVIDLHTSMDYLCYTIGFVPGFPYLGRLPEALRGTQRLATPRVRVPNGSVVITLDQTAIYPGGSPGGWRIIGLTPLTIVDLRDSYFPIKAGDTVRFYSIAPTEYESLQGERL